MDLPDTIYYDCNIVNNDKQNPQRLIFHDIRSSPILSNPELYQLSVIRFTMETGNSLPIFIPSIQIGQPNINLTPYSFTLSYSYNSSMQVDSDQIYLQHIPIDFSIFQPPPPASMQDVYNNPYYYIYSYQIITDMMNNALSQAMQSLVTKAAFYGQALPTNNAPFFEFDMENSKFILSGDVVAFDLGAPNYISIQCNTAMYSLISSFVAFNQGTNIPYGMNYKFRLYKDPRSLNVYKIDNTYSVVQLYQDYDCASLFSPISSISFCTNMIPVLPANVAKPQIIGGNTSLTTSGNNNNISSVITDFQSDGSYGFSGILSYLPQAEYRMIDLNNSAGQLNNVDITVFWKDNYANLHQMYLMSGCKCDIKILFRKKKPSF